MRMGWWIFISLITVQIILVQYMVEEFLAGHYEDLFYYVYALGFMLIFSIITYVFFRKIDKVMDQ